MLQTDLADELDLDAMVLHLLVGILELELNLHSAYETVIHHAERHEPVRPPTRRRSKRVA
jgi:hypothetical protein